MRGLKKKAKMEEVPEDSEEEMRRKLQTDVESALRREGDINAIIKAKRAAKDAANGGVRGAGFPRIDYGPPSMHTALGGNGVTDEDRERARALAARHTAGQTPADGDNTTARAHLEGC